MSDTDRAVVMMLQDNAALVGKCERLQAENAKLREQLADMPKCKECEAMFKCEDCEAMLDCDECLRADASQKERKRLAYENEQLRASCTTGGEVAFVHDLRDENAKLRELVRDMAAEMRGLGVDFARVGWCDYADRMRELGVEV